MDNSATTMVDPKVFEAMKPFFGVYYGNAGSMHHKGLEAKKALDSSRSSIAGILNCKPAEIVFTSGGTESINLAIKGLAIADKSKKHLITQKTEHPAVLETCEFMEKEGYEITYLDVDKYGMINLGDLREAIRNDTLLVSIMYANNEIGTIQPIKEISKICKERGVYFHTDACQASGLLDIDVKKLGVDLMTLNGSKVYGPKGVGLLYVKTGTKIKPLIHGGGQENKLRSGTENLPLIVGFAKALELAEEEKASENLRLKNLSKKLIGGVLESVPKTFLNGHPTERLANNVNISFIDIEGEAILLYLDEEGICASSGSACTSKTLDPSHVVIATGLPYEAAHGSIRFSLGRYTTEAGIDKLLEVLPGIIQNLRDISPVHVDMKHFKEMEVSAK